MLIDGDARMKFRTSWIALGMVMATSAAVAQQSRLDIKVSKDGVNWSPQVKVDHALGDSGRVYVGYFMSFVGGVVPNAFANLTFQPGDRDQAGLMADAGAGLLVTAMFGPSLNPNTGDWSVGCSGFWFEGGQIVYPVNEITVAGNLLEIFGRVVPGSDLEIRGASNAPSLLVDGLAIAGR